MCILFGSSAYIPFTTLHWSNPGSKSAQIQVERRERLYLLRDHFYSLPQLQPTFCRCQTHYVHHSRTCLASDLVLTHTLLCSVLHGHWPLQATSRHLWKPVQGNGNGFEGGKKEKQGRHHPPSLPQAACPAASSPVHTSHMIFILYLLHVSLLPTKGFLPLLRLPHYPLTF